MSNGDRKKNKDEKRARVKLGKSLIADDLTHLQVGREASQLATAWWLICRDSLAYRMRVPAQISDRTLSTVDL